MEKIRMLDEVAPWLITFVALVCLMSVALEESRAGDQAVGRNLKPLLKILWVEGPEYPMGIQESACGVLNGKFISAGGFTRHAKDIVKFYPNAFGGAANGFTSLTFLFDPLKPENGWTRITDIPGPPRQGAATVVAGDSLYAVGGFNYTDPFSYRSTYRLRWEGGQWVWSDLECQLPWPVCEACAVAIGTKIYLVGASDYFAAPGAKDPDFHTEAGRDNSPVGRALLMLDIKRLKAGWKRLADLPGTPRLDCAAAAAGGKLYVLGGIYSPLQKVGDDNYFNVNDSWVFDPGKNRWSRLPDMPDGANRRALTFKDRYILLVSGFKYRKTWQLDGTQAETYSPEELKLPFAAFFEKTVLVFDTKTNRLGSADPLLDQTSWPGGALHGSTIFTLGGEGGARMWHPATFQIGKIEILKP